jgi:hypothetical protein
VILALALLLAYLVIGYRIAWVVSPLSRVYDPIGRRMIFITLTWTVLLAVDVYFKRTGKWPAWYPAP